MGKAQIQSLPYTSKQPIGLTEYPLTKLGARIASPDDGRAS